MDETPRLKLPYIMPSQAQTHVTHNEALRIVDALLQLAVVDRDRSEPPAGPQPGGAHIVAAPGVGAWAGHEGQIAAWQDGGWNFLAPGQGWRAFVASEARLHVFHDGAWAPLALDLQNVEMAGINTLADATNRLALASPASLFDHDGGDHRLKINKALATDTASVLLQSSYAGRAEIGLSGSDDLSLKVSPDGAAWAEAMLVAADDAVPNFPNGLRLGAGDILSAFATGSFTPEITFATPGDLSVAYGVQLGRYWRLGDLVLALVDLQATPTYATASGQLRITGLPFTVAAPQVAMTFQHGSASPTYPAGTSTLVTRPETGQTHFILMGLGNGVANSVNTAHVPSGASFIARTLLVFGTD